MPVTRVVSLSPKNIFIKKVSYPKTDAKGIYPFRVKFENIGISVPPSAGIGIAVIGTNFVIL